MPVATPEQYAEMLDRAKAGGFAYPAFNASSSQSVNAILQGLTEAGSDGIIQVTTGGADYFAGHTVKARATGALAFAKFAHEVAKSYPITVALHTDHCPKPALEDFVLPLVAASEQAVADGGHPIFQSHMCDWKIGCPPSATTFSDSAISGSTKLSSAGFGQWSVCSATVIG